MVSRVTSNPVRPSSLQPTTTARPAATPPAATGSGAVAWGSAARPAAGAFTVSSAKVDGGPLLNDAILVPRGFTARQEHISHKMTGNAGRATASFEHQDVKATILTPDDRRLSLRDGASEVSNTITDWHAAVKDERAAPSGFAQLEWYTSYDVKGAGTAGRMVSVSETTSEYTGGAHASGGTALRTIDTRTGQTAKLDQLMSQRQLASLVNDIARQLPALGAEFAYPDRASLHEAVNSHFALTTDAKGKVQIHVAWESSTRVGAGKMAHFTVDAPEDFRAAIQ